MPICVWCECLFATAGDIYCADCRSAATRMDEHGDDHDVFAQDEEI